MRVLLSTAAVLVGLTLPATAQTKLRLAAVTCFSKGERTSGFNKICFYDCLGSTAAITISAVELCPLTINR